MLGWGHGQRNCFRLSLGQSAMILYLLILGLGILKLLIQLARITGAAVSSHRLTVEGKQLLG